MRTSALAKGRHIAVTAWLVPCCLTLLAVLSPCFSAQSPTNAPGGGAPILKGRYLIIVETSKSMERRAVGALEGIRELLFTGMRGQLREGDSIGIWTFNEELHTGKFPLQQWSARNSRQIAVRCLEFVRSQQFEKESRLQDALAAMHGVVSNSTFITIALVTTGNEYISGTPFDAAINQTFKNWQSGQQRKQMPMMTIFRARKGHYTDFAVTPLPFPIDIPPFPADLQVVQAAPKPAQTNKPAPAPLIVTGPKRPPSPATSSVPNLIVTGAEKLAAQAASTNPPQPSPEQPVVAQTTPPGPALAPEISSTEAAKPSTTVSNQAPVAPASERNPPVAEVRAAPSKSEPASPEPVSVQVPPPSEPVRAVTNQTPSVQTAIASPAAPTRASGIVRVAALTAAGLAVAVLLLWLFLRRSPPAARSSLITRSLEREQK